jgi:hypothetical protein
VFSPLAAQAFASATQPLLANFGDGLTLWRDGSVVHWSYEGQTVIVELQHDGALDATFLDCASEDAVSHDAMRLVYRRQSGWPYRLTAEGSKAMVGDMMAFFSGDREPIFAFVGAQPAD